MWVRVEVVAWCVCIYSVLSLFNLTIDWILRCHSFRKVQLPLLAMLTKEKNLLCICPVIRIPSETFSVILLTDRQTNRTESIIFLVEVNDVKLKTSSNFGWKQCLHVGSHHSDWENVFSGPLNKFHELCQRIIKKKLIKWFFKVPLEDETIRFCSTLRWSHFHTQDRPDLCSQPSSCSAPVAAHSPPRT